jgi:hypothetical protein
VSKEQLHWTKQADSGSVRVVVESSPICTGVSTAINKKFGSPKTSGDSFPLTMPPSLPSPHDSAISIATSRPSKPSANSQANSSRPHPNSPCSAAAPSTSNPYSSLSSPEQAAQDLENTAAATQAQSTIEIDFTSTASPAPTDDGYETDSLGSASTSLLSSVRNYAFENGRRYHKFREGAYNFPNDDSEQDREDMKHSMVVNLCQRLHFAELRGGVGEGGFSGNVLDMGTGTGIWAIESEFCSLPILVLMGGGLERRR